MTDPLEEMRTLARKVLPTTDGTVQASGLKHEVQIFRDRWGVPHIFAKDARDLFFGAGYVHAQDRLWQMEVSRRASQGTLAEILGEAALEADVFIRTVGVKRTAEAGLKIFNKSANKQYKDVVRGYVKGVNEFIKTHRDSFPLEFSLLGFQPSPWTVLDVLACFNYMAWQLSFNCDSELLRMDLIARLGEKRARDLLPAYPTEAPCSIPSGGHFRDLVDSLLERQRQVRGTLCSDPSQSGSNNWAVDGTKSATGKPLLAADPHLPISMPAVWYEMHLVGPGFNVIGAGCPGIPPILAGHNDRIAWGGTTLPADIVDLYVERFGVENPYQYLYEGRWQDAEVIREEFVVKGQEGTVSKEIIITRHGPVIDFAVAGTGSYVTKEGFREALSVRWIGHDPAFTTIEGAILLNKAANWQEFREAMRLRACSCQNLVYADVDGNIGYQSIGRIPIRAKGQGLVPAPGWTGEYEWIGYIPWEDMPHVLNPDTHFAVTANNKVIDEDYPYFISHDWLSHYRARRIVQLLTDKEKYSLRDFIDMQGDVLSLHAKEVVQIITGPEPQNDGQRQALSYLKGWDCRMDKDSVAASLFHMWYLKLGQNLLKEKLGPEVFEHYFSRSLFMNCFHILAIPQLLDCPMAYWFGDGPESNLEKRDRIVLLSLDQAIAELTEVLGGDMEGWWWGRLHQANFRHMLGRGAPLDVIFNAGPVEVGGDEHTINQGGFNYRGGFSPRVLAGFRQIVDMGDLSKSVSIITPGQSGQPESEHYKDLLEPWAEVKYHLMLFDRDIIEKSAQGTLVLIPR